MVLENDLRAFRLENQPINMRAASQNCGVRARLVTKEGYEDWRRVLSEAPEGSPYQLPEYLAALARGAGGQFKLVGVYDKGSKLIGGIGLFEPPTRGAPIATSRYMLYYNEPFVRKSESLVTARQESLRKKVLGCLLEFFETSGYRRVRFKSRCANSDFRPVINAGWSVKPVYSYVSDIRDSERQWQSMDRNARRQIQQAKRKKLIFTDTGRFSDFFDMHVRTHRRKGSPIYLPQQSFEEFVASIVGHDIARIFLISSSDGRPLASQLVLFGSGPVAHTLCAGSGDNIDGTGCNAYLRWRVTEWLASKGYRALDLTDAQNESVARFKSQLGADLQLGLEFTSPEPPLQRVIENTGKILSRVGSKLRAHAP
jgi:hypothetical protein